MTIPTTIEQAESLAAKLFTELSHMIDGPAGSCSLASGMIKAIFGDDAVIFQGVIPGDWEMSGHHYICSIGEFFFDLTAGQFFDGDYIVFTEEDREIAGDWEEYGNFQEVSEKVEANMAKPFSGIASRWNAK